MGFFNEYPNTNFHELNLDWILSNIKEQNSKIDSIIKALAGDKLQSVTLKDITDFGAIGDGVTDNTQIIQDMINKGYHLYIPSGDFLIKSLLVNSNTVIYGVGKLLYSGQYGIYNTNFTADNLNYGDMTKDSNIVIKGITIAKNGSGGTHDGAICLAYASNIVIEHCHVTGLTNTDVVCYGICIKDGCDNVYISGNDVICADYGIVVANDKHRNFSDTSLLSHDVYINDNNVQTETGSCIALTQACEHNIISDNVLIVSGSSERNTFGGIGVKLFEGNNLSLNLSVLDTVIASNIITYTNNTPASRGSGIRLTYNTNYVKVINNTIKNMFYGVNMSYIKSTDGNAITCDIYDNTILDTISDCIYALLGASNNHINMVNNRLVHGASGFYGVIYDGVISNNVITGCTEGLKLYRLYNTPITNNTFHNINKKAIILMNGNNGNNNYILDICTNTFRSINTDNTEQAVIDINNLIGIINGNYCHNPEHLTTNFIDGTGNYRVVTNNIVRGSTNIISSNTGDVIANNIKF